MSIGYDNDLSSAVQQQVAQQLEAARQHSAAIIADAQAQAEQILTSAREQAAAVLADERTLLRAQQSVTVVLLDGSTVHHPAANLTLTQLGTAMTVQRLSDRLTVAVYAPGQWVSGTVDDPDRGPAQEV